MIKTLITAFSIIFFVFKLPYVVWSKSQNKLSVYRFKSHEDMLDDEYIVTSWLNYVIDCIIFISYPVGLCITVTLIFFTQKFLILLGLIPMYFSPLFISFMRELGGSLMLLHLNVKKIKKNTYHEEL